MHFPIARLLFAPVRHRNKGLITYGEITGRTIRIDPRSAYPARILLHEYLHLLHPDWSETRIERATARRWAHMSVRNKARLYQRLARARMENEEEAAS